MADVRPVGLLDDRPPDVVGAARAFPCLHACSGYRIAIRRYLARARDRTHGSAVEKSPLGRRIRDTVAPSTQTRPRSPSTRWSRSPLAVAAYFAIFTQFAPYDDEGTLLVTAQGVRARRHPLPRHLLELRPLLLRALRRPLRPHRQGRHHRRQPLDRGRPLGRDQPPLRARRPAADRPPGARRRPG